MLFNEQPNCPTEGKASVEQSNIESTMHKSLVAEHEVTCFEIVSKASAETMSKFQQKQKNPNWSHDQPAQKR